MRTTERDRLISLYQAYDSINGKIKRGANRYRKLAAAIDFVDYAEKLKERYGLINRDVAEIVGCNEDKIKTIKKVSANGDKVVVGNIKDVHDVKKIKKKKLDKYIKFLKEVETKKDG